MFKLIGGEELTARGISDLSVLRPVLNKGASQQEAMVQNATLQLDEWRTIDDRVNAVLRERLTVADDLRSRGLVTPVGLGAILRITERLVSTEPAEITFDGDTAPRKERVAWEKDIIPVPVISQDFSIGWRQLEASRTRGEALDTTNAEASARRVRDRLQHLITFGHGNGPSGTGIPGLITASGRLTVDLDTDWDASGADPVADVIRMLEQAYTNNLFGPFLLYLPKNYWALAQDDYSKLKGDRTLLERLRAFAEIEDVRPLDTLPDDNVVLVQMTRDAIDLSEAQTVTTVQWEKNPFVTNFRVLMVGGPHIKLIETDARPTPLHGIVHLRASA